MTDLAAIRTRLAAARGELYWRTLEEVADSAALPLVPRKSNSPLALARMWCHSGARRRMPKRELRMPAVNCG